jgi:hypothetical protein
MIRFFRRNFLKGLFFNFGLLYFLFCSSPAFGTELSIPALSALAGQTLEVPIRIDQVDNLAGIKIVMTYDPELLVFKKAAKTPSTTSLMHIVNDRKPGVIIVVMAGAMGIKGKDLSILTLSFSIKQGLKGNHTTRIKITEAQLMSDELKDIKFTIATKPISIKAQ